MTENRDQRPDDRGRIIRRCLRARPRPSSTIKYRFTRTSTRTKWIRFDIDPNPFALRPNPDTSYETPPGLNSEKIERSMFDVQFLVNPLYETSQWPKFLF
jgi:hypothetical protein